MRIAFKDKHVLITGGSEGIGLELANLFLDDGATVTLLARSVEKLKAAQALLKSACPKGIVHMVSADVVDGHKLRTVMETIQVQYGVINVAVCSAGLCIPKLMVDQTLSEAYETLQVNYWGCYCTAHALIPDMIARGSGHICFISSMIYANPMAGFTSYSPTKAAVRHLADAMRSELSGTGVTVSIGYPPDTDTPGLAKESQHRSSVVKAIYEQTGEKVHSADLVAKCLFRGLQRGRYHLPTPVFWHTLALSLVAGITPRPQWTITEMLLAPLLVLFSVISYLQQDAVVRNYRTSAAAVEAKLCTSASIHASESKEGPDGDADRRRT